jgi:hypothetical protein
MKIIFFLVTIASFGIFALAGCGKTSENTNTAATKNEEPANKVLKPGDVSPDKAIKISELVDGVAADQDAWKDKEVTVTGHVHAASNGTDTLVQMGGHSTADNARDPSLKDGKSITCTLLGVTSADVFGKKIEVKGKVKSFMFGELKILKIEPCELKK